METIDQTKIIAVEGKDEINFFGALIKILKINDIQVINFEGKTNFPSRIKSIINTPGFSNVKSFAIIRDSDELPPEAAFESIKNALKKAGLPIPTRMNTFIFENPSIGIYIMPGNSEKGMLEDLCLASIKQYPVYRCIDSYIECSPEKLLNESKSRILCYLATKTPIVNSLGLGALTGHWDLNSPAFDDIKAFLENLR